MNLLNIVFHIICSCAIITFSLRQESLADSISDLDLNLEPPGLLPLKGHKDVPSVQACKTEDFVNDSKVVECLKSSEQGHLEPSQTPQPLQSESESEPGQKLNEDCIINEGKKTTLELLLLLILAAASSSYFKLTGTRMARLVNKFPGATIYPFIGNVYLFMGSPQQLLPSLGRCVKTYGRRLRFWKIHHPYVLLLDPKDIEVILSSSKHINKGRDYNQMHWMNGDGLITSGGDMWREDRKLLNPSFKYQRYEGFLDSFNQHGVILVKILRKLFLKGTEVENVHPALCRCTMDTVFEGVLGTSFNLQETALDPDGVLRDGALYTATKDVMKSYRCRTLKPWLCLPIIRNLNGIARAERESKKCFTEIMIKVIENRRKTLQETKGDEDTTKPFIDPLLGSRSDQNLVDHAFTIFAAGFETNATAINFVLFMLALNPNQQAKVMEELDRVFEDDRDAAAKDVAELKYLEMCILETMRLYPPAPIMSRYLEEDVILDDGMIVPKGSDAAVIIYELHNDPEVFPNPRDFNPCRFLPENSKERHPYAFIPFSKGPRSCIGQKYAMLQMKAVLSHILREFSVSTQMKREHVNIIYGAIVEIDCDLFLTLTPRNI